MLRQFLGRAPRLEQARGPGAAATSPVLHPPNDTSVLRYIGPIMLRRSGVSQDRSTVGLKRRMKEVILPASPSCSCKTMYQYRSDVQHSGFGVGQKWSIADLRTSEEDIPSSFRKIFTTTTFKSSRHSQLSFPNQTNKQGRSSKETFGALQFNSPILVEISLFC